MAWKKGVMEETECNWGVITKDQFKELEVKTAAGNGEAIKKTRVCHVP